MDKEVDEIYLAYYHFNKKSLNKIFTLQVTALPNILYKTFLLTKDVFDKGHNQLARHQHSINTCL